MYHARFKGTHYNAGYKWGELLYKNNNIISNKHTFIITEERYINSYNALKENNYNFSIELTRDILSGKYGFMCQYDRKANADTVWSVIYDIKNSAEEIILKEIIYV